MGRWRNWDLLILAGKAKVTTFAFLTERKTRPRVFWAPAQWEEVICEMNMILCSNLNPVTSLRPEWANSDELIQLFWARTSSSLEWEWCLYQENFGGNFDSIRDTVSSLPNVHYSFFLKGPQFWEQWAFKHTHVPDAQVTQVLSLTNKPRFAGKAFVVWNRAPPLPVSHLLQQKRWGWKWSSRTAVMETYAWSRHPTRRRWRGTEERPGVASSLDSSPSRGLPASRLPVGEK